MTTRPSLVNEPPENVKAQSNYLKSPGEWREFMTSRVAVEALWPSTSIAKSSLRLSVGENGGYFKTDGRKLYKTTRIFYLKIENVNSEKTISDIRIVIVSVDPQKEYIGLWVLTAKLILAAGDHTFVPLVSFGEGGDGPYFE
jgi:hypothetical protein